MVPWSYAAAVVSPPPSSTRKCARTARPWSAIFDGEIVAINEAGAPDFQELQARINLSKPAEVERAAAETPAYYYVFDVLYLDGYDLKNVPLSERLASFRRLVPGDHLKHVEYVRDDGLALVRRHMLGSRRRRDAPRAPEAFTRSRNWLR
jgi:bifunctional non-homologous end joining protein LigD